MNIKEQTKNTPWRKIRAPKTWRPRDVGEELIGYYCGRTVRDGQWGQYETLIVVVPEVGAMMISGTKIIQLADIALLENGQLIRVKFCGRKLLDGDREMKDFELYVADDDATPTIEDVVSMQMAVNEIKHEEVPS